MEFPATGGPQLRVLNSIHVLNTLSDLTLVNQDINASHETNEYFRKASFDYFSLKKEDDSRFQRDGVLFKVLRRIKRHRDRGDYSQFLNILSKTDAEVIWFGFGNISYRLIKKVRKKYPDKILICDTDSVWSRYLLRGLPYLTFEKKLLTFIRGYRKRFEERKLVKLSDITTAVSEIDANYYKKFGEEARILPFSNVINLESYSTDIDNKFDLNKFSILLAGSYGEFGMPMNVATRWFLKDVFPLILHAVPEAHLYIVGRRSEKEFGGCVSPNVTVTGLVDSVLPFLKHSRLSIVPLHFESGTRFKILEAGASRIPIVSTTLGAEGIAVVNGVHLLIADSPDAFADSVVRILLDNQLSKNIADNCYDLVSKHYCLETLKAEAESILKIVSHLKIQK